MDCLVQTVKYDTVQATSLAIYVAYIPIVSLQSFAFSRIAKSTQF